MSVISTLSVPVLPGASETGIALVIGNSDYPFALLDSPKDDAQAIEAKLKGLGYQVTKKIDLGRERFVNAIHAFGYRLQQPARSVSSTIQAMGCR